MKLHEGQIIGSYRVIRPLGEGGMGAVYEVEHTQLGVRYALKAFTSESGHVDVLKNKFLTEGKVLARLHDPHLVRVFDLNFDESTGTPYFVMDLVLYEDGEPHTLSDVETGDLEEDYILNLFTELASALDYIHAQGIVHRDIKLGNVLLSSDGHVVLSDFGISRLFSERLRSDVKAVNTMVSQAGTSSRLVMGTQGYMAPEVDRGEEATPAADSYSMGVMFVYLLTGIWYTPGSKVFRLLETLEYRWVDVLPRLLAENPEERPTDLLKLAETLRSVPVSGQDAPETSETTPRRDRRVVFALAGAAVLVLAAVGFFVFSGRAESDAAGERLQLPAEPDIVSRRAAPPAEDGFEAVFGVQGIYERPRK